LDEQGPSGVVQALQQHALTGGVLQGRPRLNMGLPMDQMVSGVLAISAALEPSDWEADVQVEAARTLGLGPQEICFDWQVAPLSDGEVTQVHWVACRQDAVHLFKQFVRRAGGQLASVEPVQHAAQRAASCLSGGMSVLLTRPVQDWQFDLALLPDTQVNGAAMVSSLSFDSALREALQTTAGPRLVAAGLALKAWT
jgi:Tfp pilus assembly PilM family ATPase